MSSRPRRVISWNPRHHEHITPASLEQGAQYSYTCIDNSILAKYVLRPWWHYASRFVPRTTSANMVTLTGFVAGLLSTGLLVYLSEGGKKPCPSWAWLLTSLCCFVYQTLDAVDGMHARRTKTSSFVGELFDHGCDALFTPMLVVNLALCLQLTPPVAATLMLVTCFGLFISIWENASTKVMTWGYVSSVTEGNVLTQVIFLIAGIRGQEWFTTPIFSPALKFPLSLGPVVAGVWQFSTPADVLIAFHFTFGVIMIVMSIVAGFHALRKDANPDRLMQALFPMIVVTLLQISLLRTFPEESARVPFVTDVGFGFLCAYAATDLTALRFSSDDYKVLQPGVFWRLIALGVPLWLNAFAPAYQKDVLVWLPTALTISAIVAGVSYLHLLMSLIFQFSRHLKVGVLFFTSEQRKVAVSAK